MKQRIVLLGPPASGKGSQARMISQKYGIPAVSTGHLLRDEAAAGTELGKQAAKFTSKGRLAPDELAMTVLQTWVGPGRPAFILDGFPRTIEQAHRLERLLASIQTPLDAVFLLECSSSVIEDRVLNRVTCSACANIFKAGVQIDLDSMECPSCGGLLIRRSDDTPAVLAQRMEQYSEKTGPLAEFYAQRGLLSRINAEQPVAEVFSALERILAA